MLKEETLDRCTTGMCVCTDENGDYVKECYLDKDDID